MALGLPVAVRRRLVLISPDKDFGRAFEEALGNCGHDAQLSIASTVNALLDEIKNKPGRIVAVVFQPPSVIPAKVARALHEVMRLFRGIDIYLISDAPVTIPRGVARLAVSAKQDVIDVVRNYLP